MLGCAGERSLAFAELGLSITYVRAACASVQLLTDKRRIKQSIPEHPESISCRACLLYEAIYCEESGRTAAVADSSILRPLLRRARGRQRCVKFQLSSCI